MCQAPHAIADYSRRIYPVWQKEFADLPQRVRQSTARRKLDRGELTFSEPYVSLAHFTDGVTEAGRA